MANVNIPLAERMRPKSLDEYVGQRSLVGPEGVIRRMLEQGGLVPFILWGPPGVGKTTLARIVAKETKRGFFQLSAVSAGVKEVRQVLEEARHQGGLGLPAPLLFIDEIHRFSKSQQDSLLGAVEEGIVVLVGATTENPSFEVISPLLSRCQVYTLTSLAQEELEVLLQRALTHDVFLRKVHFALEETAALYGYAGGDGRRLLNIVELLYNTREGDTVVVRNARVEQLLQVHAHRYDKRGEMHYDLISAFIKSVRGSDPQGAVYWLARMLQGGEDPVFIARRLVILSAEDIGLANPNALLLANAAFEAVRNIGMPEARIPLSEVTIYLACSAKSNAAYLAINGAMALAAKDADREVPLHLRNAETKLMEELGYHAGYKYAHDYPGHFVEQEFLPRGLERHVFYRPQPNPIETELRRRQQANWKGKYDI